MRLFLFKDTDETVSRSTEIMLENNLVFLMLTVLFQVSGELSVVSGCCLDREHSHSPLTTHVLLRIK